MNNDLWGVQSPSNDQLQAVKTRADDEGLADNREPAGIERVAGGGTTPSLPAYTNAALLSRVDESSRECILRVQECARDAFGRTQQGNSPSALPARKSLKRPNYWTGCDIGVDKR